MCEKTGCKDKRIRDVDPRITKIISDYSELVLTIGRETAAKSKEIMARGYTRENEEELLDVNSDLAILVKFMERGKEIMLETAKTPLIKLGIEKILELGSHTLNELDKLDSHLISEVEGDA